ncbi:hypothetical protein RNAN_3036 [Rheinheimera nanhaiensis E407-8]|uniref:Uncharacterized protein n=1 Tax=Rheinheimera nanhaiensis E407-8 TaxID=562729 RepID=I1E145_9GAMM|nr:hypothetical protein RNAN_3036 [Rheinheimera nanhaiensis E407-8]
MQSLADLIFWCFYHNSTFFCAKTRRHNSVFSAEKIVSKTADLAKNRVSAGFARLCSFIA